MAGLTPLSKQSWTAAQNRAQFAAVAHLRWSLFRNNFRRKGGGGELAARILFVPIIGVFAIGPILGAGFAGNYIVSTNRLEWLPVLTWSIFALWQLVSINISPPSLSFDINILLRFPVNFPRYLAMRLFFGLLSASNVVGTLALIAADIGIGMARYSLLLWATLLLGAFAAANIFFTRMVFAWVDRWLSTRRARELLTGFILFASLGFQYLNATFNPGLASGHHSHASYLPLFRIFRHIQPIAAVLPPGLTATSIARFAQRRFDSASFALLGLLVFAIFFLSVYAWRVRREFSGENLSEVLPQKHTLPLSTRLPRNSPYAPRHVIDNNKFGVNSAIAVCLQREWIYLRRNSNQLYGFLGPLFMVFLFAGRIESSGRLGDLVLPASLSYSILGVAIFSYNCLGMDGAGVQFYFFAPVCLRDVFLAKNLIGFLLILIEFTLIFVIVCFVGSTPSPLITVATAFWLLFTVLVNGAVGNLRSLTAPKKIDFSKISRTQTSQLSALIALGVIAVCLGTGLAADVLATRFNHPWLMVPILMAFAIGAFVFYLRVLNRLDILANTRRQSILDELCKA